MIKKALIIIINTLALLTLVELGFYLSIGEEEYPTKLEGLLTYTDKIGQPKPAQTNLDWPEEKIFIRAEDDKDEPEVLLLGGESIPGTYMSPATIPVSPEEIPSGSKNIFVIGGSAAFGYTCSYNQSFATILNQRLGSEYNAINAAQAGWSSSQLVPVVKRISDYYNPSLLIIMCGNNEFIGWSMKEEITDMGISRGVLQLSTNSHALSYLLYQRLMARGNSRQYSHQEEFIFHKELRGYKYALQNPAHRYLDYDFNRWKELKGRFLKNFENNLITMIYYAKQNGAEVLLMTVPFNYRLSPVWKHPQPWFYNRDNKATIESAVNKAVAAIESRQYQQALKILDNTIALEPELSLLHYLRAHSLEQIREFQEAELAYEKSREYMVGNLGSIPSLNRVTLKAAASNGVGVIDLKKAFDEAEHSKGHYFNETLVRDDCHPSDAGQALIAKEILRWLGKSGQ